MFTQKTVLRYLEMYQIIDIYTYIAQNNWRNKSLT